MKSLFLLLHFSLALKCYVDKKKYTFEIYTYFVINDKNKFTVSPHNPFKGFCQTFSSVVLSRVQHSSLGA